MTSQRWYVLLLTLIGLLEAVNGRSGGSSWTTPGRWGVPSLAPTTAPPEPPSSKHTKKVKKSKSKHDAADTNDTPDETGPKSSKKTKKSPSRKLHSPEAIEKSATNKTSPAESHKKKKKKKSQRSDAVQVPKDEDDAATIEEAQTSHTKKKVKRSKARSNPHGLSSPQVVNTYTERQREEPTIEEAPKEHHKSKHKKKRKTKKHSSLEEVQQVEENQEDPLPQKESQTEEKKKTAKTKKRKVEKRSSPLDDSHVTEEATAEKSEMQELPPGTLGNKVGEAIGNDVELVAEGAAKVGESENGGAAKQSTEDTEAAAAMQMTPEARHGPEVSETVIMREEQTEVGHATLPFESRGDEELEETKTDEDIEQVTIANDVRVHSFDAEIDGENDGREVIEDQLEETAAAEKAEDEEVCLANDVRVHAAETEDKKDENDGRAVIDDSLERSFEAQTAESLPGIGSEKVGQADEIALTTEEGAEEEFTGDKSEVPDVEPLVETESQPLEQAVEILPTEEETDQEEAPAGQFDAASDSGPTALGVPTRLAGDEQVEGTTNCDEGDLVAAIDDPASRQSAGAGDEEDEVALVDASGEPSAAQDASPSLLAEADDEEAESGRSDGEMKHEDPTRQIGDETEIIDSNVDKPLPSIEDGPDSEKVDSADTDSTTDDEQAGVATNGESVEHQATSTPEAADQVPVPEIDADDEDEDEDEETDAEDEEEDDSNVTPRPSSEGIDEQESPSTTASDPYLEPDIVNFIGGVLKEDVDEVRAWTEAETSSSDTNNTSLNTTRGGSQVANQSETSNKTLEEPVASTTKPVTTTEEQNQKEESEASSTSETTDEQASVEDDIKTPESETASTVEHPSEASVLDVQGVAEVDGSTKFRYDRATLECSEDKATDISVSVVTWNLAEESPSEDDAEFIRAFRKAGIAEGSGSELVLISGQECENIKPRRTEGRRSREYRRLMVKMLGKNYVPIAIHLLGGIQFGLFARKSFLDEIEDISIADITCGLGNVFHNKGAIAAFVTVKARNPPRESNDSPAKAKSLKMVFVTAHLAAHVKNSDARDADFWRISSELAAQAPEGFLPLEKKDSTPDDRSFLFDSVDRAFFCGDLNYRVDLPREVAEGAVLAGKPDENFPDLLKHDQLFRTIAEGRAFPGFTEGKISFAPTFKFDKGTGEYDTSHKQRIPAWTDRILFKPWGTRVISYDSVPEAQHSDHRPVLGRFRVNMEGRELPPTPKRRRKRQGSKRDQ